MIIKRMPYTGAKSIATYLLQLLICSLLAHSVAQAAPRANAIDFWDDSEEQSELKIDYSAWEEILEKYVVTDHASNVNRFNYGGMLEADKTALDNFILYMQQMDPRQLTKQRQKAFWLNLFNAGMIQEIALEDQPQSSIKEKGSRLWRKKRFYITMQEMSFDDIEHGILRPIFNDPRVHFSLVAGTVGSGRIIKSAFSGENVEQLLEENTKEFLSHERGFSYKDGKLFLSQIFKWYQKDFGTNFKAVKNFIRPYVSEENAAVLIKSKRASYQYDWALNRP